MKKKARHNRHVRHKRPKAGTFRLVYRAEILPAFAAESVRAALVAALELDERRAGKLFSGRRTVVRRAVDEATALRYVARFAELGARLRAEPEPPPTWRPQFQQEFLLDHDGPTARRWLLSNAAGLVALGVVLLGALASFWTAVAYTDAEERALVHAADAARAVASQPPLAQPGPGDGAALKPGVPVMPADAAADADALDTLPAATLREYRLGYAAAKGHKAFAVSDAGAFGWTGGARTTDEAREAALSRCTAAAVNGEASCSILDADGVLEK